MAHLIWDWNGTLLDDLALTIEATNAAIRAVGGGAITEREHRRIFRRPLTDYYSDVLGRPVSPFEFERIDYAFHSTYRLGLTHCQLATDAHIALSMWTGTQSLLSMWSHEKLVPELEYRGLINFFLRVDGCDGQLLGDCKSAYLKRHLKILGLSGTDCVVIGDSIDDADAAEAVGARCVLYAGGITDPDRLGQKSHPVAMNLMDAVTYASMY